MWLDNMFMCVSVHFPPPASPPRGLVKYYCDRICLWEEMTQEASPLRKKKGGQVTLHLQLDGCRATHLADKSVG